MEWIEQTRMLQKERELMVAEVTWVEAALADQVE